MLPLQNQNITSISQKLPEKHLNFDYLREEGLKHIGKFSGKLWTDHNSHDPGITILEVLIYALMDLGYRANLPIEDLLAKPNPNSPDDNFFTPAQILTCNPVTITDFRKLLMEIDGVKNAWLGISEDCKLKVNCIDAFDPKPVPPEKDKCSDKRKEIEFYLNGIYEVCLEKESDAFSDEQLVEVAHNLLSAHRNLCEDFLEPKVLKSKKIGICADIELLQGFKVEDVYEEVLRQLRNFLSPSARTYTLQEMLKREKSIEEIYAGMPYFSKLIFSDLEELNGSFGFIDTEELEAIPQRKEIHLSDLYSVIHSVEGVKTVRNICIEGLKDVDYFDPTCSEKECPDTWIYCLDKDCLPAFDVENTTLNFFNRNGALQVNSDKIKRALSNARKVKLQSVYLDLPVPTGFYREDLTDYVSIQNEFPRVYGIGEVGLPENAPVLRKTQAKQLQAYLLFFDQMLADYLNQLGNLRNLFSLRPESEKTPEERRTIFSEIFNENIIPGYENMPRLRGVSEAATGYLVPVKTETFELILCKIEQRFNKTILIKFFNDCYDFPVENGLEIDQCAYKKLNRRDAVSAQIVRDFKNGNYSAEVKLDSADFYFVLCPKSVPEITLIPTGRFPTKEEAKKAMNLAIFIASLESNFAKINLPDLVGEHYSFLISGQEIDYVDSLQQLAESPEDYCTRREVFLNHLLSRFSESFSDYATLIFDGLKNDASAKQKVLETKSQFLSDYDDISRNRGKAFDYRKSSWGTDNISGFEQRINRLTCLGTGLRNNICNIEIRCPEDDFWLEVPGSGGKVLLYSETRFPTSDFAEGIACELYQSLKAGNRFIAQYNPLIGYQLTIEINGFQIVHANTEPLLTQQAALAKRDELIGMFNDPTAVSKTESAAWNYKNILTGGGRTLMNATDYDSPETAKGNRNKFIQSLNKSRESGLFLLPFSRKNIESDEREKAWLNVDGIKEPVQQISDRFIVKVLEENSNELTPTNRLYDSESEAKLEIVENRNFGKLLFSSGKAECWEVNTAAGFKLSATRIFTDKEKLTTDWQLAKIAGAKIENFHQKELCNGWYQVELRNESGGVLAASEALQINSDALKGMIQSFSKLIVNQSFKPGISMVENSWGYQVSNKKGEPVLVNFNAFSTKVAAYEGLMNACECGKKRAFYVRDHNSILNSDYVFFLKDEFGNFIGECPQKYPTSGKRNGILTSSVAVSKKTKPVFKIEKAADAYLFEFSNSDETISFISSFEFSNRKAAQTAFNKFIIDFFTEENPEIQPKENAFAVKLKKHEPVIFKSKSIDEPDSIISQLKTELESAVFKFDLDETPIGWRFTNTVVNISGDEPFQIQSKKIFKSEEDAKIEGDYLKANFSKYVKSRTAPGFSISKKPKCSFEIVGEDKETQKRCEAELAGMLELQAAFTDESYKNWVKGEEKLGDDKDCGEAKYQLVKRGNPQAYLRCWGDIEIPEKEECSGRVDEETDLGKIDSDAPCLDQLISRKIKERCTDPCPENCEDITDCYDLTEKELKPIRKVICEIDPKKYCWLEICPNSPHAEQLPTGENDFCKWHYVIKGSFKNKFKNLNLLTSIKGYDSQAEAEAAYGEDFWELLEIASDKDNFGTKICLSGCFDLEPDLCGNVADSKAVLHEDFQCEFPGASGLKDAAKFFKSFPIRYFEPDDVFYFQLFDFDKIYADPNTPTIPNWTSWECFDNYETAQNNFNYFLDLLKYPSNCRLVCRGGKWRLELAEVLMESCRTYTSVDEAWGRDACNEIVESAIPVICEELEESEEPDPEKVEPVDPCPLYGVEEFLYAAQCEGAFQPFETPDSKCNTKEKKEYGFKVVSDCYEIACHPCEYDTCEDAEAAMKDFIQSVECDTLETVIEFCTDEIFEPTIEPCSHVYIELAKEKTEILETWNQVQMLNQFGAETGFKIKIREKGQETTEPDEICCDKPEESFKCDCYFETAGKIGDLKNCPEILAAIKNIVFPTEEKVLEVFFKQKKIFIKGINAFNAIIKEGLPKEPLFRKLKSLTKKEAIKKGNELLKAIGYDENYLSDSLDIIIDRLNQWEANLQSLEDKNKITIKCKVGEETIVQTYDSVYDEITKANRCRVELKSDDPCGPFSFRVVDDCCILAKSPVKFSTCSARDEAMRRAKECVATEGMHLLEHILLRPKDCEEKGVFNQKDCEKEGKTNGVDCDCMLWGCPDCACHLKWSEIGFGDVCKSPEDAEITYLPFADAYSFWGTLVLPSWLKRFAENAPREFFEKLLRREAPSHVALNILWLSPRQFCEFEDCYKLWLDSMVLLPMEACDKDRDPHCEMIECLKKLCNTDPCLPAGTAPESCVCDKADSDETTIPERFNILKCEMKPCKYPEGEETDEGEQNDEDDSPKEEELSVLSPNVVVAAVETPIAEFSVEPKKKAAEKPKKPKSKKASTAKSVKRKPSTKPKSNSKTKNK